MSTRRRLLLAVLLALLAPAPSEGQWTNRYPKVANFAHHVYLEGYNLPTLNAGPGDPAVSPDGRMVAVSARGWLWLVDAGTRVARRVTRGGPALDFRPAWSPDGRQLAFVRDDTRDTSIWLLDLSTGAERLLVNTPALDLDPCFSRDGKSVLYSSAEAGDLDVWRVELASGRRTRLTTERGLELRPQPLPGDREILFVSKQGSLDSVVVFDTRTNARRAPVTEGIASMMSPALAPGGQLFAVNLPEYDDWRLWLYDLRGAPPLRLSHDVRAALAPAWSPDGRFVYFVEPGEDERFRLWRVPASGGAREELTPVRWDWGEATARVTIRARQTGSATSPFVRLTVTDRDGHTVIPEVGQPRFDGQNGVVFFYAPGAVELEVPAGELTVTAARGFDTLPVTVKRTVAAGRPRAPATPVVIELPRPLHDPGAEGWRSADAHSHLNYGGPYHLAPEDILPDARAEGLDLAMPQLANLHVRFTDLRWKQWRRLGLASPRIVFSQEVRSHFLGHVGLIAADELYWPWFYGPGYPVYTDLDLPNYEALRFARRHGGVNSYVHPVSVRDPFPKEGPPRGLPLELVPDAVLGDVDTLEVACLWSDELGTSEAWYRLLNLGLTVAPSAGSDTMHNFYRTMAIGSARVYVRTAVPFRMADFLEGLRRGRSFVTTGPLIRFDAGGAGPGGVLTAAQGGSVPWRLDVWSALPVEKAEMIVNGRVVWSGAGLDAPGHKSFNGRVEVPRGGWVAARVYGGRTAWPSMDSYPFAHTAPVWFGRAGSTEPEAAVSAARDLLRWLDEAEKRLAEGYSGTPATRLRERFAEARRKLEAAR